MQRRDVNAECEVNETQNCWLRGRTPIFLSFHSTVSCRSDISLRKPSCFKRSWRISWTTAKGNKVWEVEREQKEKGNTCIYTVCGKRKLWNATCSLFKWLTVAVFLTSAFFFFLNLRRLHFCTTRSKTHKYSRLAALHFVLASLSSHWTGTEAHCGHVSLVPIPVRDKRQLDNREHYRRATFNTVVPSVVILWTVRPI